MDAFYDSDLCHPHNSVAAVKKILAVNGKDWAFCQSISKPMPKYFFYFSSTSP
jgi:hypothetical protein